MDDEGVLQLSEQHWKYVDNILKLHGVSRDERHWLRAFYIVGMSGGYTKAAQFSKDPELESAGLVKKAREHYLLAFIHGFKHGSAL